VLHHCFSIFLRNVRVRSHDGFAPVARAAFNDLLTESSDYFRSCACVFFCHIPVCGANDFLVDLVACEATIFTNQGDALLVNRIVRVRSGGCGSCFVSCFLLSFICAVTRHDDKGSHHCDNSQFLHDRLFYYSSPSTERLKLSSVFVPAKSSNALSVTRMILLRINSAPSRAPSSGCLMQHSHSITAQPS